MSFDELDALARLDLSANARLDKARDLFLIGAYTGLRFSDFTRISPGHIETDLAGKKILTITTPQQAAYFSTHAPKLRVYGLVQTAIQVIWAALSFVACRALFDQIFSHTPALIWLSGYLAAFSLIVLHVLLRTTYQTYWYDKLDDRTETDSSFFLPFLIMAALVWLDYAGAKMFFTSQVPPPATLSAAPIDSAHGAQAARLETWHEQARTKLERKNDGEAARHSSDLASVNGYAWALSLFFMLVFAVLGYATVRINVKSGILPVRQYTDLDQHGSPLHKIWLAVSDGTKRQLHRFAVWLHDALTTDARELTDFDGRVIVRDADRANGANISARHSNGSPLFIEIKPNGTAHYTDDSTTGK